MAFSDQFKDYKWIKVKQFKEQPEESWESRYYALWGHHVTEADFLVNKVRELAAIIDKKDEEIKRLEQAKENLGSVAR